MGLSQYCAYFFVTRRLGIFADRTVPADAGLPSGVDRPTLAEALSEVVDGAALRVHPHVVRADKKALQAASASWQTVFNVRDSLIACSFFDPSEPPDAKKVKSAFGDYIVARWVFREVFKLEIRQRPLDRAFPPPFDGDAKTGMAESLVKVAESVGLPVQDSNALIQGASKWETLGGAGAALMKQVTP